LYFFTGSVLPVSLEAHGLYTRLIPALEAQGIPSDYLREVYTDPQYRQKRYFSAECDTLREKIFSNTNEEMLVSGVEYYYQHQQIFEAVKEKTGIPPEIILSILRRETVFGVCVGDYYALQQLTDLYRFTERDRRRAFALKQIYALFTIAEQQGWSILELLSIPSSSAGAFGLGNFIPESFRDYAVDGDKNGTIDLFEPEDAIHSIAHYLVEKGWHGDKLLSPILYDYASICRSVIEIFPNVHKGEALFRYNNSCGYVQKIIDYAIEIRKQINPANKE